MFFKIKHPESFVVCLEVFWIGFRIGLGKYTWGFDLGRGIKFGIESVVFGKKVVFDFALTNTFRFGTVVTNCGCSDVFLGPITFGYSVDHPDSPAIDDAFMDAILRNQKPIKAIFEDSSKLVDETRELINDPIVNDFEEVAYSDEAPDAPISLPSRQAVSRSEQKRKSYKEAAREAQIESQEQ